MIGAVVATLAVGCITLLVLLIAYSPKPEPLEDKYKVYDGKPFPSINDKPEIDISIVVPSYNEEQRLEIMMTEALEYLKSTDLSWEVVIVDDGSKDKTCQVAQSLSKNEDRIRLLKLPKNRGKGGAVQQGVLVSRGREILFVDADGATKFSDLARLRSQLNGGVAIGSRAHMVQSEAVVKRTFVRNFLMRGFHFLVFLFGIRSIKDTQCGFKLFSREAARKVFTRMHVQRWIFDIEILILCELYKIPVAEVPVTWHEVDGTKMDLVRDSIQMLVQLLMIRLNYLLGLW